MGLPSQPHVAWVPPHAIPDAPPSAAEEFCELCGATDLPDEDIREGTGFNVCRECASKFMEDQLDAATFYARPEVGMVGASRPW